MNKEKAAKELVPELRFPEFENSGAWKQKKLSGFIEEHSERTGFNTKLPVYSSTREGLKPQNEYYDGRNLENKGEYGVVPVGHIVYRHMSDDDVFKFNINNLRTPIAVSKEYPVFSTPNLSPKFLISLLNESTSFLNFCRKQKKGGTRTRLYLSVLKTWGPYLPDEPEQTKIADCLDSIDQLIEAHTNKLKTLENYKKGLMQQLFPAAGQNVPALRFPEFRDGPEWEEKSLRDIAQYKNGKAHESDISEDGSYIVVNSKYISSDGKVVKHSDTARLLAKPNDILMVLSDVPNGKAIAKCLLVKESNKYTVNQRICIIRSISVENQFLFHLLNRNTHFLKFDDGVKQTNLKKDDVLDCHLLVPRDRQEQNKISQTLESIDLSIDDNKEKLTILGQQKKGLMQQLFPAMD